MEIYFYDLHKFEVVKLLLLLPCTCGRFFLFGTFNVARAEGGDVCSFWGRLATESSPLVYTLSGRWREIRFTTAIKRSTRRNKGRIHLN